MNNLWFTRALAGAVIAAFALVGAAGIDSAKSAAVADSQWGKAALSTGR